MRVSKLLWTFFLLGSSLFTAAQDSDKYLKQLQQDSFVLYFAVPMELKAADSRTELVSDFTYHDYEGGIQPDKVIMNFSLINRQPVKQIDSLMLYARGKAIGTLRPTPLYIEKEKRNWHTRFTAKLPADVYLSLLRNAEAVEFRAFSDAGNYVFPTDKKWRKAAGVIVEIFTLN